MIKFIGGVVVGVFVGALALEVLGRTHPQIVEKVQRWAGKNDAASEEGFVRSETLAPEPEYYDQQL